MLRILLLLPFLRLNLTDKTPGITTFKCKYLPVLFTYFVVQQHMLPKSQSSLKDNANKSINQLIFFYPWIWVCPFMASSKSGDACLEGCRPWIATAEVHQGVHRSLGIQRPGNSEFTRLIH